MVETRPHGLPPCYRLRSSRDFARVRRSGRKIHTPHFIIYCLTRDDGPTRLGLTVSRKVGGAVQRNRLKRRLREFFRQHRAGLPRHTDLSIIAKKDAAGVDYQQICTELLNVLGAPGRRNTP